MRISQGIYGQAAEEIQVLTTAMVVKIAAPAVYKEQSGAPVRVHQVSSRQAHGLFGGYAVVGGFRLADFLQLLTPAAAE